MIWHFCEIEGSKSAFSCISIFLFCFVLSTEWETKLGNGKSEPKIKSNSKLHTLSPQFSRFQNLKAEQTEGQQKREKLDSDEKEDCRSNRHCFCVDLKGKNLNFATLWEKLMYKMLKLLNCCRNKQDSASLSIFQRFDLSLQQKIQMTKRYKIALKFRMS